MNKNELILELIDVTEQNLKITEALLQMPLEELNKKKNSNSWSALECVEHLIIYGKFYLPEIEKAISKASLDSNNTFKSGVLGSYFVKLIKPKEKLNKMKTLNKFNPVGSQLDKDSLVTFKEQQIKILALLSKTTDLNITKAKTAVSISKLIKLRLGDTFQFVIYHNQRHLNQAKKALEKIKEK